MKQRNQTSTLLLHGRLCAVFAVLSSVAHVAMTIEHRLVPWERALMLGMAIACLGCALHLWRRSNTAAAGLTMAMGSSMAIIHVTLLFSTMGHGHGDHGFHGTPIPAGAAAPGQDSGAAAMLGIIVLEIVMSMLAATLLQRHRMLGVVHAGSRGYARSELPEGRGEWLT